MIEVIKGSMQVLQNVSSEEMECIKKELTLDNPAYQQVKKFSRYQYTSIPPFLTFYSTVDGKIIVPRGYKIPFEHKVIRDDRVERKVLYPKFKLELRDTQQEAFEAWNKDRENGMIVLQTGKGKSILGCYLAYATKQRALVIVQKNDLVDGWMNDLDLCFGLSKDKVGLIKAGKKKIGKQITIATIQTLNRLDSGELRELYNAFGMVICDEVHHSPAKSYNLFKFFQAKYFIGLTATDQRPDGLQDVQYWLFGNVAFRSKEDVNDEDIMPYTVKIKNSSIEYNPPDEYYYGNSIVDAETAEALRGAGKRVKRKSLNPQELKKLLRDRKFNELVARDIYKEYSAKKSCIAFLHEKEHIRELRDILIEFGVPREQIQLYYGDAKEDDSVMKQRAESKEVLITLATFAKATEGTNVKAWERGFLVTSINNEKNVIQAVGRCRRRKEGKEDVIIYDYAHPKVKGMSNHINTRLKAYKQNKAKIIWEDKPNNSKGTIIRGWKKGR